MRNQDLNESQRDSLIAIVAESQDGSPIGQIREAADAARFEYCSPGCTGALATCDALNTFLGALLQHSRTLEDAIDNLCYAHKQLQAARKAAEGMK